MNVIARPPAWTLDSFLAWEREQEGRFEFDGKEPVEMNGGTLSHAMIASQLLLALGTRLDRARFIVLRGDLKVLSQGRIRYPDLIVLDRDTTTRDDLTTDPILVAEVLSPSTAKTDLIDKAYEDGAIPSVLHYVILEQTRPAGLLWSRDQAPWAAHIVGAELSLSGLNLSIPMSVIYEGVPMGTPADLPPGQGS